MTDQLATEHLKCCRGSEAEEEMWPRNNDEFFSVSSIVHCSSRAIEMSPGSGNPREAVEKIEGMRLCISHQQEKTKKLLGRRKQGETMPTEAVFGRIHIRCHFERLALCDQRRQRLPQRKPNCLRIERFVGASLTVARGGGVGGSQQQWPKQSASEVNGSSGRSLRLRRGRPPSCDVQQPDNTREVVWLGFAKRTHRRDRAAIRQHWVSSNSRAIRDHERTGCRELMTRG